MGSRIGRFIQIMGTKMARTITTGSAQVGTRIETAGGYLILIIEDNLPICEIYSVALRSTGHRFQIQLTHSGEDGVEAALKDRPHLVILDLSLPGISGQEVAEQLRLAGIFPDVPLIIATGEAEEDAKQIQANAYLEKPFPLASLVDAVHDALRAVVV